MVNREIVKKETSDDNKEVTEITLVDVSKGIKREVAPENISVVATTYLAALPLERIEPIARKYGFSVENLTGTELAAVKDLQTVQVLNVERFKDFKIRYRLFMEEIYKLMTEEGLNFEQLINDKVIESFAVNIVGKVNEVLRPNPSQKEEVKSNLLEILDGIIFDEEAELLATAFCSIDTEVSRNNIKEFLKIYIGKTAPQLFAILVRRFQTLYFFNFVSKELGRDYLTYSEISIKALEHTMHLTSIKVPDPSGTGYYYKEEKMAVDKDNFHFYTINVTIRQFLHLVSLVTYFLSDLVLILKSSLMLDNFETISRRVLSWQKRKLEPMLIEMKEKASVQELKLIKEAFNQVNAFLLEPLERVIADAQDTCMTVVKNTIRAKGVFKMFWLGTPPGFITEMLPIHNLEELKQLMQYNREQKEALVKFIKEFNDSIDELIKEKETQIISKKWENVKQLAETIGRFLKGIGGML